MQPQQKLLMKISFKRQGISK